MLIIVPPLYAIDEKQGKNLVIQIEHPGWSAEGQIEPYASERAIGYRITFVDWPTVLLLTNGAKHPEGFEYILRKKGLEFKLTSENEVIDLTNTKWERHPHLDNVPAQPIDFQRRVEETVRSWRGTFSFKYEKDSPDGKGLREPQIGAVHMIQGHWAASDQPATIVMPTGTGKTETMISTLVATGCSRVLVVVPTDALRTQLSRKFLTLGILKELGVVAESARYPIVGVLGSRPQTPQDVNEFFQSCNVIVTTMSIAGQSPDDVQQRMAEVCPYLFIDEAHHIQAPTWKRFKAAFSSGRILQFTATPFRNDDRPVEGKIIFNYPLKRAQEKEYFKPIDFKPVVEFNPLRRDAVVAEAAVEQLRADIANGFNHLLMARVSSIGRAEEVLQIYEGLCPEFNPVQIHTGIKSIARREEIKQQVIRGESRIVVCVDMLGEGFDLPELKIAAFHDIRKSLPITLQLAGRFTRARSDLGDATVIANTAEIEVREELRKLYQHDVDWNHLLPLYAEGAIQEEVDLWEFLEGFRKFPDDISLQNVRPAMSAVAYKTHCDEWQPGNFSEGLKGFDSLDRVYFDHNPQKDTLVVVTTKKIPVDWAQISDIYTWDWQLYVFYWDRDQELLFIHNSSNSGFFEDLAKAVAGGPVELIRGADVFRCFAGVNRLRLQNVGLLEQLGRLIRFIMRAGSDVGAGLTEAQKRHTTKSNIFGSGFEFGSRTTIGCSYKGRIWSRRLTNIKALVEWCQNVGSKLLDESIDPEEVLRGTLVPVEVSERPVVMPVAVEWPEWFYFETEARFHFEIDSQRIALHDVSLEVVDASENGPLKLSIHSEDNSVELTQTLTEKNEIKSFSFTASAEAFIIYRSKRVSLVDFFNKEPPTFWFADGSSLTGNSLIQLKKDIDPFDVEKVEFWDWAGVDIQKESQGITRESDSIQRRVIEQLNQRSFDIIFDDDDSGEAADVVTIRDTDTAIEIEFYHCKFSGKPKVGHRIKDLYEVCGQAQKSIRWMEKPYDLFTHLLRREPRQRGGRERSRIEKGSLEDLRRLREKSRRVRVHLSVFIVQPGVSKAEITQSQLELLAVTENYLMETYLVPFGVIVSP